MNAMQILKLKGALAQFQRNHPKFSAFLRKLMREGVEPDSVLEVTIRRPDGGQTRANLRMTREDLALLEQLKALQEEK